MSVVHPAIGGAIYQAIAGAFNLNREMGEPPAPEIDLIIAMFDGGRQGLWYKFSEFANLSQDTAGALPYTALDQPVGRVIDSSPRGNTATQITTTARPMIKQVVGQPKYLTTDGVDDRLLVTLPAIVGTMIVGMAEGTLVYTVNIPAGVFPIGTNTTAQRFSPSKKFTSYFIIAGVLSEGEIQTVIDHMQSNGAGPTNTLVGVTNTTLSWVNFTQMTSFPLLDFSNVTNASYAWNSCSGLTSFPLLDLSNVTNATDAWSGCTKLTTFATGMFSTMKCTNFTNAFNSCKLTQSTVDNILTELVTANKSNGTVNITGGTSSAPSATGLAAKATLVSRGWTVTHN